MLGVIPSVLGSFASYLSSPIQLEAAVERSPSQLERATAHVRERLKRRSPGMNETPAMSLIKLTERVLAPFIPGSPHRACIVACRSLAGRPPPEV